MKRVMMVGVGVGAAAGTLVLAAAGDGVLTP
jgi:hypothetical protein